MNAQLRDRIFANDRLLKALIVLLVHRDPNLMEELEAVFQQSQPLSRKLNEAPVGQWADLRNELDLIRALSPAGENDTEH